MEFPDLGHHCNLAACNRLDFLPMKCSGCKKLFCNDHLSYSLHNCPTAHTRDVQVPVCPLCDKPIPVNRNELPDIKMSQHIDSDCQSDPAKEKRKAYTNACSVRKCKKKELVPVNCNTCRKNFCLKHRHPTDHECAGPTSAASSAASAAMARASAASAAARSGQNKITSYFTGPFRGQQAASTVSTTSSRNAATARASNLQGGLSEDEALARALQESMQSSSASNDAMTQEEQDRMLALSLQESEAQQRNQQHQQRRTTTAGGGDKNCILQ